LAIVQIHISWIDPFAKRLVSSPTKSTVLDIFVLFEFSLKPEELKEHEQELKFMHNDKLALSNARKEEREECQAIESCENNHNNLN
jgi:hypothetical protein